jgi:hypothetical protein|tara:strand:+ start:12488 stop:12691 length:204 start_codon:yes stop_codon:yes gene_type:complete
MKTVYALKNKAKMRFGLFSTTEAQLNDRIEKAYWLQRGMETKGSDYPLSKFMEGSVKVKLKIEEIEE